MASAQKEGGAEILGMPAPREERQEILSWFFWASSSECRYNRRDSLRNQARACSMESFAIVRVPWEDTQMV